MINQDWVLARFREDTARSLPDPSAYTVEHGRIWLYPQGNGKWLEPVFRDGALAGLLDYADYDWLKPHIFNPRQVEKITEVCSGVGCRAEEAPASQDLT